ncbi:hypothetical protein [Roseovarius sp.]|uniref:hypothetical protein n=1 Tax=Roseovarius sp. TaxID=1486281 RepID=UPI00260CE188|nr:hypothetical protein [Roseovarius sp.]
MKNFALGFAIASLTVTPVIAEHNNPWATPTDTVLAQFHEENQEVSIDTPGEDEMNGRLVQNVSANAGEGLGGSDTGGGSGQGGGQGGGGQGGGGQGGGGRGG